MTATTSAVMSGKHLSRRFNNITIPVLDFDSGSEVAKKFQNSKNGHTKKRMPTDGQKATASLPSPVARRSNANIPCPVESGPYDTYWLPLGMMRNRHRIDDGVRVSTLGLAHGGIGDLLLGRFGSLRVCIFLDGFAFG